MIFTLFGYPKTGKTLLFNLLTDKQEDISKFSTAANKFHKALIDVPDPRLDKLAELLNLPPVHAQIDYLDTGPISFGEVKNSTFIDLLRRADGLVHVARGFDDPELLHPLGSIDPARDIQNMEDELLLVDLVTIEKRLEKLEIDLRKMKSRELEDEFDLLKKLKIVLEEGKPLRQYNLKPTEDHLIRGFKFLTIKPLINLINADEKSYESFLAQQKEPEKNTATIVFCAQIETELLELPETDRAAFENEFGLKQYRYIKESFINSSYRLMNLISFFTIGKQEAKAWTISGGTSAYEAAGKIHSDIQQGFIRAEVIGVDDFLESGGFAQAREKGILRLEGKEYQINDGEIIHFRFGK
jgi:GTP-binding protein YchF